MDPKNHAPPSPPPHPHPHVTPAILGYWLSPCTQGPYQYVRLVSSSTGSQGPQPAFPLIPAPCFPWGKTGTGYLLVAATEPSWAVERAGRQRPRECGSGGGTIAIGVPLYSEPGHAGAGQPAFMPGPRLPLSLVAPPLCTSGLGQGTCGPSVLGSND